MYAVTTKSIENEPGTWNSTLVSIFNSDNIQVGSYTRNYPSYSKETFAPFQDKKGNWFALYSPHYTGTRVISLPECKDLGGEDDDSNGFCPTELWVPQFKVVQYMGDTYTIFEPDFEEYKSVEVIKQGYCPFAFVSGCVWGDDSSWKLQVFDLSRAHEGALLRIEPFGYFELHDDHNLRDSIQIQEMDIEDSSLYFTLKGKSRHNVNLSALGWVTVR